MPRPPEGSSQRRELIDLLLTPGEVAAIFRVDPKTVTRWIKKGKFKNTTKTLGGHNRVSRAEVIRILKGEPND